MSDTNTNNDAINNKNNNNINGPDVGNFLLYYALGMLGIILWVLFGTAWLYISKLATSGIPSDTKYEPYSCDIDPDLGKNPEDGKSVKVSMNSIHILGMKGLAFWQMWSQDGESNKWEQEATFDTQDFLASFNGSLIQEFRDSANIRGTDSAAATGFDKFCSIVLNNVAARGFKWYDTFSLSDKLNDSFKIFIYGLFGLILFPIIWVLNGMCSFYYLCKAVFIPERPDDLNNGGANDILGFIIKLLGEDESGPGGVKNWFKYIGRGFIWLIFWLLIFPILSFFVCPLYATFMPFFKLLWSGSYSLKVDNKFYDSEQSDTKSFWDFIKDTFAYKRTFLLFLSILNLFTCANTYLGEMYFGAVGLAVILAIVFGDIFVDTAPNDNTMILQQNNYIPKPPKSRRQPIHKGCMFPGKIKKIDDTLHKLDVKLTLLIQQSKSVSNLEIENLIQDLKIMRADLNNEFTKISMSEIEVDVDNFGKKVENEYESKITELREKIEEAIKEKAAKEAAAKEAAAKEAAAKEAEENQKVIDEINTKLKEVYTKIYEIETIFKPNSSLSSDKLNEYKGTNNKYKAEALALTDSVNKEASNEILEKCKTLYTEVTTFKTELDSEINSLNSAAGGVNTGSGLSAATSSSSSLDTSGSSLKTGSDSETDRLSNTSSSSSRPSITSNNYNVPVDRGELITYVNDRDKSSIKEQTMNPMGSTVVGRQGGQLTPMNVSQENTVPTTNKQDTSNDSVPASVTKNRSMEYSSSNEVLNPLGSASVGIQGGQMIQQNSVENNIAPGVNPRTLNSDIISVDDNILASRIEGQGGNTSTNPIHAKASANAGQKIGGSTSPGILSKDGRLLTLTFLNNSELKLKIGDCIEFTKNGKQQFGKIVGFYRSNSNSYNVDVIFIDLFDEIQGKFIAKTVRERNQEINVLDVLNGRHSFITNGDTTVETLKQLLEYPKYRPDGIALTDYFSNPNLYNDAGVWQTIKQCDAISKPAQNIFYQNNKDNNQAISDLGAYFDREIARTKKGGGSKSKTLKKKQQNIKIRLV